MRANIRKILANDYEVIEAGSSISAIKKIAINRPDLVLLDYEMPEEKEPVEAGTSQKPKRVDMDAL